ncbi:MAG: Na+/H+ antiporter subunit E [Arenicellales bacterium]|nr:Na+/H+ antiporter subunit E [Arenicellales bacterium]
MKSTLKLWPSWALRCFVLAGLWVVISDGDTSSWLIGVPAVVVAAWASTELGPRENRKVSLLGALGFVSFFLFESLRGGLDVARRTLTPVLKIQPGFLTYTCRLPAGGPRILFANCVSLLPGTLTAEFQDDVLTVHVLDTDAQSELELQRLEEAIAAVFVLEGDPQHA